VVIILIQRDIMADIEMCDTADWGCKVSTAHVPEHAACSLSCISAHV